jgi:2-methylisocitrate lyase-like PEP mutase family enzyme
MPSVAEKRARFRALHEDGCFVIPNPWDVGSARYLQHLGFKALATTSSGAAFAQGLPDGGLTRDATLAHIRLLAEASDVPINADFCNGFADDPQGIGENVRLVVATGAAGFSIEDRSADTRNLYETGLAVERIQAARAAIGASDALLVARSECYLTRHPEPLKEAIRRLQKYAEAGADCLFAPGVTTREDIVAIVNSVAPKPLNVLVGAPIGLTVAELGDLGVRRVSVGGALARVAWAAFTTAARELAASGSFDVLAAAKTGVDLNALFRDLTP